MGKITKRFDMLTLYGILICTTLHSQVIEQGKESLSHQKITELSIGDKVPSAVWKTIQKKKNTKLVILDFWSTYCSNCMDAFPKMEKLQKQFDDRLQVVLVNSWESGTKVQERLKVINEKRLKEEDYLIEIPAIPCINGDTVLKKLFPANVIPHHIWLDQLGTVLYVTHGYNATPGHIQKILNGERIKMTLKKDLTTEGHNFSYGLIKTGHQSLIPKFYSGFIHYNPGVGSGSRFNKDTVHGTSRRTYINTHVLELYQTAFTIAGKKLKTILEVKKIKDYQWPDWLNDGDIMDEWMEKNVFSYEISVPLKEEINITQHMQADLNRFFLFEKSIEGKVEKRKISCLILIKKDESLLPRTAGGESKSKRKENTTLSFQNYSFGSIMTDVGDYLENKSKPLFFINETGIDNEMKVDINLIGDLKDVENVRKQLRPFGLDIIEGEREVDVLVIREIKKNN